MAETDNGDNLEVFAVEQHRFTIDAEAPILPQLVSLAHEIVRLQKEHDAGARVRAIIVEMERPTT